MDKNREKDGWRHGMERALPVDLLAYTLDMWSITSDSVDRGCTYTLIWPRRRREIGEGNEVGGDGTKGDRTKGDGGKRVGSSCLLRWGGGRG